MSKTQSKSTAAPDEIASRVVDEFAAENKGVAEVIPADRIRSSVETVVAESPALDEADYEDLYVDVKDAVLEQGVIIA